ncbi:PepSY domain-containing protein [Nonomuraea sp. KC401]|uniref:PepSY domain-containing protein n=1 Tax=unclassified Nonomuraea TaxID=2593643 RepID=UPI0010FEAEAA|nr:MULTISPECIES: PepSY domain-containing protein [unclassified Nonomuraea]NBE96992.1 peptidase [Nonomuraea sp. K271]TLF66259.1 PepSY domain-containing protein [Nonomuraea sp. KC401]
MRITKKFIVAGAGVVTLVAGGGAAVAATTVAAPAPKVTAEQAIEIAHKQVAGAWVSELDLDSRDTGADVWEIELTKGAQRHELTIDAATGKVAKNETEQQSDKDDDDRDDRDDRDDKDDD